LGKDTRFFASCVLQHLIRDFVDEEILFILIAFDDPVIIHSIITFIALRQLVVFSLKGLVQNLIGPPLERSSAAKIANTDRHPHAAMDIAFVAPLSKFQLFHGLGESPFLAEITNHGFVFSCHCPVPGAVACASYNLHDVVGCVSCLTLAGDWNFFKRLC
jgi:hypothetical protein